MGCIFSSCKKQKLTKEQELEKEQRKMELEKEQHNKECEKGLRVLKEYIDKLEEIQKDLEEWKKAVEEEEEEEAKDNTYVHESVFSTNVRPWFKEQIEDTLVSPPDTILYPDFLAYRSTAFMITMVLIVGKYLYRKFVKKQKTKKRSAKTMP